MTFHQRARNSNYNKGCSPLGSRRVAVIGRIKSCAMKASVGLMGTPVGDSATQIQFCSTITRKPDEPVSLMNSLYYKRTSLQPHTLIISQTYHLAALITSQTYHLTTLITSQTHHLTPLSTR